MKKALNITVAGTLFTIEEDAYSALDTYLKSVQSHFGSDPDKVEILKDIEARIAEQLMERRTESGIVTIEAVEQMISVMGRVEDFGSPDEAGAPTYHAKRKLYRNPDDSVIAGVCSGIAAYFGLDPVLVRFIFVALVLLGFGAGVIVYIIMALVLPKADTPAEKLQMRGGPVTLSSFKESVEEQIAKVNDKRSAIRNFLDSVFNLVGRVVRFALRALRWIVGFGFIAGALFVGIASTFGFVNLVFNADMVFMNLPIPVLDILSHAAYLTLASAAYLLLIIPVIFIGAVGLRIVTRRKTLNAAWSTGLGAVWIISLIVLGSIALRVVPTIAERVEKYEIEHREAMEDAPLSPIAPRP